MLRRLLMLFSLRCFSTAALTSRTALRRLKKADLVSELSKRSLPTAGKKDDLIIRLWDVLQREDATESDTDVSSTAVDPASLRGHLIVKGLSSLSSNSTGVGFVFDHNHEILQARKYLPGDRSSLEADYSAIVLALQFASRRGVQNVSVQSDQDVIVHQINGLYRVHRSSLVSLYWQVMRLKESFDDFSVDLGRPNDVVTELAVQALATGRSSDCLLDEEDPMERIVSENQEPPAAAPQTNEDKPIPQIDPSKQYLLQFDGGARGNPPTRTGAGMVLYDEDEEIWCGYQFIERAASNNVAEYTSLLLGIKCALALGIRRLRAQGDSELIVKQLTGHYQVKNDNLRMLWRETKEAIQQLDEFEIAHIRRAYNKRADWLANNAMDQQHSYGFDELISAS